MFRTILIASAMAVTSTFAIAQTNDQSDTLTAEETQRLNAAGQTADAPTGERNPQDDTLSAEEVTNTEGQPTADAPTGERNPQDDTLPASETNN